MKEEKELATIDKRVDFVAEASYEIIADVLEQIKQKRRELDENRRLLEEHKKDANAERKMYQIDEKAQAKFERSMETQYTEKLKQYFILVSMLNVNEFMKKNWEYYFSHATDNPTKLNEFAQKFKAFYDAHKKRGKRI